MEKGASVKTGLSDQMKIDQKAPRGETKGDMKPVAKTETVKSDRGSFPMK